MKKIYLMIVMLALVGVGYGQIISQYIETNFGIFPKGIEIWNNTSGTLDFSTNNLVILKGVNGAVPVDDFTLESGTLLSGGVLVIGTSDMEATAVANGASFILKPFTFNGDDALEVKYGAAKTDVFGTPGVDPGPAWSGNGVSTANQNIQLEAGLIIGDTDGWSDPSVRFKTVSTDPIGTGGQDGFGIAPICIWKTDASSNDWVTGSNWEDGIIPASVVNINIPVGATNYPTISASASCNNITIEDGATLLGAENLTVNGTFTMQKTIANNDGWHLLSSPVSNLNILGSDFVPAGPTLPTSFDFYSFDETAATFPWINIRAAGNTVNGNFETSFTNGKGYLVAYSSSYGNTTFDFTGTLNTGSISSPTLTYSSGAQLGANLIGNPYPSAINWSSATKTQFIDNYAYIYNEVKSGGAGYEYVIGTIAANQGFVVLLKSANHGQTFGFTSAIQTHGGSFLKNTDITDKLSLKYGNSSNYDELNIIINDASSIVRDRNDAIKFFSFDAGIPQVYSLSSDESLLAINSIPSIEDNMKIHLGIYVPKDNYYYISLDEVDGKFMGKDIFLEDKLTGNQILLTEVDSYQFEASLIDDPNRFILHFSPVGINESGLPNSNIQIYSSENTVYIINNNNVKGDIEIVNMIGQKLASFSLDGTSKQAINFTAQTGLYIVNVKTDDGYISSQKIIISK